MTLWRIGLAIAVLATICPPVDSFLDASMARHMLIQMPLLAGLGYCGGLVWPIQRLRLAPTGLTLIIFVMGSLLFWMLPRSLDTAVTYAWVDQVMHANMLTAGWSLAIGLPRLPFQAKIAFGIYALAMALAAGLVYASAVIPVCSTYTVQQQNEAGVLLLWIAAAAFVALVVRGALLLTNIATTKPLRHVV